MKRAPTDLLTDLYQLTMAAGYFHRGVHEKRVSFELFVRRLPPYRRYMVFAGLETVLEHLRALRFTEAHLDYLRSVPALRPAMSFELCEYLRDFRFSGEVWAMPEGTVAFAQEPLIRITGTLFEAQLVETYLLSAINTETAAASKAARVVGAAQGRQVMEFGSRRTSPEEAVMTARAAYLAGFTATSNVEAGYRWDIPLAGTAAHSWTMAHATEREAFEAYLAVYPKERTTLLVDTYDTLDGVRNAIRAAPGGLGGVRLDSGDLDALARGSRALLDEAGLKDTRIVATGDLNEHKIAALLGAGAPVDVFGVGTELARCVDSPNLGAVYKMVHDHDADRPVLKLSEGKATLPGVHQVYRVIRDDRARRDIIGTQGEFHVDAEPLLVPWMKDGALCRPLPSLAAIRKTCRHQLAALPEDVRRIDDTATAPYPVATSDVLNDLLVEVQRRSREEQGELQ
ncbi:MAG: nicotinate phosphoribosyltransferase [Deltaproteobacteria bacterium]|nr:nicotinate phosphoribosyltransferase [Deltaproteobacteria bacterium]